MTAGMAWLAVIVSGAGSVPGTQTPAASRPVSFAASLEYEAALPGCPAASEFETLVTSRLGYDPFRGGAADRVIARVARRGRAIEGRLEWRDHRDRWVGEQTFPSRTNDCGELVRAMGFALAVQMQLLASERPQAASDAAAEAPATDVTTTPDPTEPPAPASGATTGTATDEETGTRVEPPKAVPPPDEGPAAVAVTPAPPPSRDKVAFALGAGTAGGLGLSDGGVALGRVFAAATWSHLSLELAGEASLPATIRRADGAGFAQQLLLAGAGACAVGGRWSACAVFKAGQVRIAGRDIDAPASTMGTALQSGLRLGVKQPLGSRFFLAVQLEGLLNLARWTVRLDQTPVWTAPRLAGALGLDLGVRFE
jgi:hypothetical protein